MATSVAGKEFSGSEVVNVMQIIADGMWDRFRLSWHHSLLGLVVTDNTWTRNKTELRFDGLNRPEAQASLEVTFDERLRKEVELFENIQAGFSYGLTHGAIAVVKSVVREYGQIELMITRTGV